MQGFDFSWETIYANSEQINKYPYDLVVSTVMRYFSPVENRSSIRVLDMGCGAGNHTWFFAREGFTVTAIDASESGIAYAKKRMENDGLEARFEHMSFSQIARLDGGYDLILDRESICTLEWLDIKKLFSSLYEKLSDDGIFISFMFNKDHPAIEHCGECSSDGHTYYKLPPLYFGNSSRVTLLDNNAHAELFEKFKILEMHNHSLKNLVGDGKGMAEYVTVAQKKSVLET